MRTNQNSHDIQTLMVSLHISENMQQMQMHVRTIWYLLTFVMFWDLL